MAPRAQHGYLHDDYLRTVGATVGAPAGVEPRHRPSIPPTSGSASVQHQGRSTDRADSGKPLVERAGMTPTRALDLVGQLEAAETVHILHAVPGVTAPSR
jgi:hypothetical protein